MAFDKKRVLAEIGLEIEKIVLPGTGGNLISNGMVERIIAQEGKVTIILKLPPDLGATGNDLKEEVRQRVLQIDQILEVQVLAKVHQSGAASSPTAATGAQSIPGVRHTVAVASGKGGVGKSTVSVNLAIQLSVMGHRVGLLDSDVYGPSIPMMLGLTGQRPKMGGDDQILPIEKHGLLTMSIGFLLEEDSPVIWRGPMVSSLLRQFLFQVVWGELDYLILDLPPGTGDAQLTLVQSIALGGGIIVTTPQDVALLDVQRGIQMFRKVEVPILGIVENMSHFDCPHCGTKTEIFSSGGGKAAAERFEVPFLASIPLTPSFVRDGDDGIPTVIRDPESSLSKAMKATATALLERLP